MYSCEGLLDVSYWLGFHGRCGCADCVGPLVPRRLALLERLEARVLTAPSHDSVMNEAHYSRMRDLVCLALHGSRSNLCVSWCASSFGGISLRLLGVVESTSLRYRSSPSIFASRGRLENTVAGAPVLRCSTRIACSGHALLDRTSLMFLSRCGHLAGADLLANAVISVRESVSWPCSCVCEFLVVCFNHWERMRDMLPLSGDVSALDLLRRLTVSRQSAKHASSQRRGVCDGISGTTRVCAWLDSCAFVCLLFACSCIQV